MRQMADHVKPDLKHQTTVAVMIATTMRKSVRTVLLMGTLYTVAIEFSLLDAESFTRIFIRCNRRIAKEYDTLD